MLLLLQGGNSLPAAMFSLHAVHLTTKQQRPTTSAAKPFYASNPAKRPSLSLVTCEPGTDCCWLLLLLLLLLAA
jgi:hypothetical protein